MDVYKSVLVTPTITAGGYSAGDVVGGLLTFDFQFGSSGGGILLNIHLYDDDAEKAAGTFYVFTAPPLSIADNGPFPGALTFAQLCTQVYEKTWAATDYITQAPGALAHDLGINKAFGFDRYLYAYFVVSGTPTYTAATDIAARMDVLVSA